MADDHVGGRAETGQTPMFVLGLLVVLFVLWWARGGPQNAPLNNELFFTSPIDALGLQIQAP